MPAYVLISIIDTFLCFSVASVLYITGRRRSWDLILLLYALAVWMAIPWVAYITPVANQAKVIHHLYDIVVFIPALIMLFALRIIGKQLSHPSLKIAFTLSFFFIFLHRSPLFDSGSRMTPSGIAPIPGPIYTVFSIYLGIALLYSLFVILRAYQIADPWNKPRLQWVGLACVFVIIARVLRVITVYGGNEPIFHGLFIISAAAVLGYILLKDPRRKDIDHANLLMGGHIYFQTLSAAVQFDLFSLLYEKSNLTRAQIAQALGIEEKPARILLLGCATLGLLKKDGDSYSNSTLAKNYLTRQAPRSLIPIVLWQHHINYQAMIRFYDALKANSNVGLSEFPGDEPSLYQRLAHHPRLEKIFQDAMQAISQTSNTVVAKCVDFSKVKNLLDVGGGNGSNIINLAKSFPHIRASVFDSPSVCKIAADHIKAEGLSDRLGVVPGNCFEDEFPQGFDCIHFGHFFTIWSEEKNLLLLKKCYRALPSGGSVILFNMMQSDSEDGPLSAAMGSPYFLTIATGEGMLYTPKEYVSWMKQAGFKTVKKLVLPTDLPTGDGIIIGRKG